MDNRIKARIKAKGPATRLLKQSRQKVTVAFMRMVAMK